MMFDDFINTPKPLAMVISVGEYMEIKSVLQEIYSAGDIEHIDDFCRFKPRSEKFLLCNPQKKRQIITPMMYFDAVTFVDRVPFRNIEF